MRILALDVGTKRVGLAISDELKLIGPAQPAFRDDHGKPDALTVEARRYRLVFMAFPFEGTGTATDRDEIMRRVLDWLGQPIPWHAYLPALRLDAVGP